MVEEKPLGKIIKIKRDETGKSDFLKSALKKPKTEITESKEQGILDRKDKDKVLYKAKETLNLSSKELGRSIIREPAGSTGKEAVKSSSKGPLKLGSKDPTKLSSKDPVRSSAKEEAGKLPVKESIRSIGRDLLKVSKELGKGSGNGNANGNGKEQHGKVVKKEEKSIAQELGLTNGKESGKSKDSVRVKEERDNGREKDKTKDERDKIREKDKGKAPLAKPSTPGSASKVKPSSVNSRGATSSEKLAVKKVTTTTTTKTTTTKTVKEEKKGKKVYSLPGQKHEPPEERDPLRVFYSTLREQMPDSEMAEVWLMEHGLLTHNEAKLAFDRKQKRVHGLKHSTPMKSSPSSRMSNGSTGARTPVSNGKGKGAGTSKGKKRVDNYSDSDSDDDFLQNRLKKKLKA